MFKCFRKPTIKVQIACELDQARRDLLEAEAILERAEANQALLTKRVERLEITLAAEDLGVDTTQPQFPYE